MRTRARQVAVIVFDEVELLDVAGPAQALSLAGRRWNFRPFKLELVAATPGLVATRNQVRLEATAAFAGATAEIVVVPGGYGARRLVEADALGPELVALLSGAELVGAVGWGVPLVARAGLATGARLAAPADARSAVLSHAPDATIDPDEPLVRSGRLFTASASAAALELGLALIGATLGPKLVAMVRADLGLPTSSPERIEIRYDPVKR